MVYYQLGKPKQLSTKASFIVVKHFASDVKATKRAAMTANTAGTVSK
jgi:hypothetical protein